jgi:Fe-S cluster biogenesis protein NfuA
MSDESDSKADGNESLRERVAAVIARLQPMVQADGGDIELVDVDDDGVVSVRLSGACVGCPSAGMTLSLGIERNLKDQIPEVSRVVCV